MARRGLQLFLRNIPQLHSRYAVTAAAAATTASAATTLPAALLWLLSSARLLLLSLLRPHAPLRRDRRAATGVLSR
jgi:hypothetical protein